MNTISKLALTLLTLNSLHHLSAVQVNHQTGAVSITEQEVAADFIIKREYSSRSIYHGMFGIGWCSNFDYTLTRKEDSSITLLLCGKPLLRFEKSTPTIYRVPYRLSQIIVSKGDSYFWTASDGYTYVFNALNALYGVKSGNSWVLRLDTLEPAASLKITRQAELNLITKIEGPNGLHKYQYENTQLKSVSFNNSVKVKYSYDSTDNLVLLAKADQFTLFEYEANLDRITKIIKPNGTTEIFKYNLIANPKNKQETHSLSVNHEVLRGKEKINQYVSQYFYRSDSNGELKLVRANLPSRSLSESTEVQYAQSGLPTYIRQRGKTFKVLFSPDRKVSELRWNNESYLFLYNHPEGKLTSIIERNISPQFSGNQIVSRADFNYDRIGRLINASSKEVYHPYDLQNLDSDYAFKQVVPFEPVRALAAIRGG
jgi:hypothetical protein